MAEFTETTEQILRHTNSFTHTVGDTLAQTISQTLSSNIGNSIPFYSKDEMNEILSNKNKLLGELSLVSYR
jgi:hypothetical protein